MEKAKTKNEMTGLYLKPKTLVALNIYCAMQGENKSKMVDKILNEYLKETIEKLEKAGLM